MSSGLTLGPILFHWPATTMRDFYFQISDEAPIDTVYLGEVVCSKRAPFFKPYLEEVITRLERGGKTVVLSTLAEVMLVRERHRTTELCTQEGISIEANDAAALSLLRNKPHRIGPYINVYNEDTLAVLASHGAIHCTLPPELPSSSLAVMARHATNMSISLEVQVYGRIGLALSARCYHARAHGRTKDNCGFVCETDPDGMELRALDGTPFLAINGVQTLSYRYLNLVREVNEMQEMGIHAFRLSPHSHDMIPTAHVFRSLLDHEISADDARARLEEKGHLIPYANGFYHHREGHLWLEDKQPIV